MWGLRHACQRFYIVLDFLYEYTHAKEGFAKNYWGRWLLISTSMATMAIDFFVSMLLAKGAGWDVHGHRHRPHSKALCKL